MSKTEHPLQALASYLPDNSFEQVAYFLQHYKVHLTITRQRQSVLGDYRNAVNGKNHRISVNGNLNKYAFLITLLHELAHLLAFEQYGHRIQAHGREWKSMYSGLLKDFIARKIFPPDVEQALHAAVQNPAASSCAEDGLMRVLYRYDEKKNDTVLLEDVAKGACFITKDGRIFKKGEQLRKRFRCIEKDTGLVYLISPLYEVKLID
ncbi:SprT-like domain-containing protein [Parafilimonas sp.]|uniref:SprT-like domain-containing protein n=1 Tax=Parafilimonas sp. TaxID=1969739 RepID=UPI0039E67768